ncbi:MAG: hypothetical protein JNM00_09520 [Flavobacteriales bacterium]|nr:hypothetical protein [Flavobacteriales bacterium]
MTITLPTLINNLEALLVELESSWPDQVSQACADSLALIEERITTQGLDDTGKALKPYTDAYLRFKSDPKRFKRGRELGLGSSRYTGKVDYMLIGEFWRDVQVLRVEQNGDLVEAVGGVRLPINKSKLESLNKRDGLVLDMSDVEKNQVHTNTSMRIFAIIERHFPDFNA